eukprot:1161042-Pelagomonas_calceolata.AAC.6
MHCFRLRPVFAKHGGFKTCMLTHLCARCSCRAGDACRLVKMPYSKQRLAWKPCAADRRV